MGAKVDILSIGRCQYMRWNVQIGVGNLYTELFVTDILIIPHVLYEEIVKLLTLTARFCHKVSSFISIKIGVMCNGNTVTVLNDK